MRLLPIVVGALTLAAVAPATAHAQRLVVGFDRGTTASQRLQALRAEQAAGGIELPRLDARVVEVPDALAPALRRALQQRGIVRYVETDATLHLAWTPNDTSYSQQWALGKVGAASAWDRARGAGVLIADLDTGVDYTHPDLAGKVTLGPDYVAGDNDPKDEHGHGTHVAGIAAAITDNARGVAGLAPEAQVLAVRVLDANGSGSTSNIARGITWATDNGAKVINLSLGGPSGTTALADAISYATSRGVLVACAAGNDSRASLSYPAAYAGCTSVGATTSSDARASYSNYGTGLDVVAPGSGLLSAVPGGRYESWSGTSMATPMVSGLAALLYSTGLDRAGVLGAMTSTAKDLGASGYDTTFGYGRINAAAALASTSTTPPPTTPPPTTPPTNTLPACTGASYTVRRATAVTIPLRCTDANGDVLRYSIVSNPQRGSLSRLDAAAGTVRYTASWFSRGADSFRFTAADAAGSAAPATISITVT